MTVISGSWTSKGHSTEHATVEPDDDLVALDEAMSLLAAEDPQAAKVVELRYISGPELSIRLDVLEAHLAEFQELMLWLKGEMEAAVAGPMASENTSQSLM